MEHKVLRKAEKLQKSHTKKQRLYRGLSILAAGVVFCTTYALILPAITLDNNTICGMDEHEHTDDCYTATGSWRCMDDATLTEADYVAHVHSESCTAEDGTMRCPLAEWPNVVEPHEHTDECYRLTPHEHGEECMVLVQGELICTEPVSDGHRHDETCLGEEPMLTCELPEHEFHTDNCYDSNGNIICGMENHVHDAETCYTLTPVNVCGLDESEGHHHDGTCYAYVTAPGCGMEEGAEVLELVCEKPALHTHTDECYTDGTPDCELTCKLPVVILHEHTDCYVPGEPTLTCGLEEHEHKDECYETTSDPTILVNGTADSAMPIADFDLTGKWADDLVTVAQSQGGKVSANYGAWYTETYGEAADNTQAFVSWCLNFLEIPETTIPQTGTVNDFVEQAEFCGILRTGIYYANVGDIVVHMSEYGDVQSGIVYYNEETESYGVIGVQNDTVTTLDWNFEDIVAWVCLEDVQPKTEEPDEPVEETEYLLEEDKWDPVAWQALIDSGWFTYWEDKIKEEDRPTLYDGENPIEPADKAEETSAETDINDEKQIDQDNRGSEEKSDDDMVTVAKTIDGTDKENVFDITLKVTTQENIKTFVEEPDMAVVIVMDISNTMRDGFKDGSTDTKYEAAMQSAENFVDDFIKAAPNSTVSKIGVVAFNTNSHTICDMTTVSSMGNGESYKDDMRNKTGVEMKHKTDDGYDQKGNPISYGSSHRRFTNMEGGLALAQEMLNKTTNSNKFIIFLTDGLPTTYLRAGSTTEGYDPYTPHAPKSGIGQFYNEVIKLPCKYGTDYSNLAAIRARTKATEIKNSGISIYSVGVGLSTFDTGKDTNGKDTTGNGWEHIHYKTGRHGNEVNDKTFNTIDRGSASDNDWSGMKTLEIYDSSYTAGDNKYFENWLEHKIGSDFYEDCANKTALENAFENIFGDIKTKVETSMTKAWTVEDPLPGEFAYLGKVKDTNTGEFDDDFAEDSTIYWDLKVATAEERTDDNGTKWYTYSVTYRVRLKNEEESFVPKKEKYLQTNGTTTLTYRYIETEDGQQIISEEREINFPIPQVKGYLGKLNFGKQDNYGNAVSGATFLLYHDADCNLCRLNAEELANVKPTDSSGAYVTKAGYMVYIATSGEDGAVSFDNIPSGHEYTLVETVVPDGYYKGNESYNVAVQFGETTVTVTSADGTEIAWDTENPAVIINHTSVELPNTGGGGTKRYISVGVVLMTTSLLWYAVRRKQRE